MELRWWQDVLLLCDLKRYLDDRQARKYWLVSFGEIRLGHWAILTGVKIRCPKGRAGSTPALGTK